VSIGKFEPDWLLFELFGEDEKPFPNIFIDIIKYLFGFIALFFPINPSFLI
jgi:hypothetical protein